jgi:hypothetical protein
MHQKKALGSESATYDLLERRRDDAEVGLGQVSEARKSNMTLGCHL